MTTALHQLRRSATILLCAYRILCERAELCQQLLPKDVKARGMVVWAVNGAKAPKSVELRPACGRSQMMDVGMVSGTDKP